MNLNGKGPMSGNNMFGTLDFSKTLENETKKKITDKLLIPLFQKKWDKVNENFLLFSAQIRSLEHENDELYSYLLKTIELLLYEHKLNKIPSETLETTNPELVFILPPIQLKPEYEIYKLIFGIPKQYDKEKLEYIRKLLKNENITFDKIKNRL